VKCDAVVCGVLLGMSCILNCWFAEQLKAERAAYVQHRQFVRAVVARNQWIEEHHLFWKRLLEASEGREREQRRREMWNFERGPRA